MLAAAAVGLLGFVGFRRGGSVLEEAGCPSDCSARGVCHRGTCYCNDGWTGHECAKSQCPHACHGHGTCTGGKCVCHEGFTGIDCWESTEGNCPQHCSGHGWCLTRTAAKEAQGLLEGPKTNTTLRELDQLAASVLEEQHERQHGAETPVCVCAPGWRGAACSIDTCPGHCSGHGVCLDGACGCEVGFTGDACDDVSSPSPPPPPPDVPPRCPDDFDCSGNGDCVYGACVCRPGFGGERCSELTASCPGDCSDHGQCVGVGSASQCKCALGYAGDDCGRSACADNLDTSPGGCHGRGSCECDPATHACECRCHVGFKPPFCAANSCFEQCNGPKHGECVLGHCVCTSRWRGLGCGSEICPLGCSAPHGECRDGECVCTPEWQGPACAESSCPNGCSAHGTCKAGACTCAPAYKGLDCSRAKDSPEGRKECAQRLCSGEEHGVCKYDDAGPCICKPSWTGADCSVTLCPKSCSGNGFCTDSGCQCYPGYLGKACDKTSCRHDCSGHGKCHSGTCQCDTGWASSDCAIPLNPRRRQMAAMPLPGEPDDTPHAASAAIAALRAQHARAASGHASGAAVDIEEVGR